jgi:flagellar hook-length control protein FliK
VFQRLISIIAEHGAAQSDANADKQFSQNFAADQTGTSVTTSHQTQANLPAAATFSNQVVSASAPAGPAQTASPLYAAIDPHAVIEQLVKGITMRNFGTTSEVRMRLQPQHLGDVALKLTVTGNTIAANVVAQNSHVRDLLLANQQQLARTLSEAGLSLGNFSVDVSGGNAGFTQQHAQQQRASARPGAFDAGLTGEDGQWTDPRFGPPLVTTGKSLVLNYLV